MTDKEKEIGLAELLHYNLCPLAHEDVCGWYYQSWEAPRYDRMRWLDKARDMIEEYGYYDSIELLRQYLKLHKFFKFNIL